jgi:cytoskeletal protein CcmA (bactofilin family)
MEQKNKTDLRINGLGSSSGGSFNMVQINGKGDVNGDLECNELEINGLGSIHGNVRVERFRVSGKSNIVGDVSGNKILVDGITEIDGRVKMEQVENRGMFKVSKDCASEVFDSQGGFVIGGLLNAGKIDITVYATCKVKEIGGEQVNVRFGRGFELGLGVRKFINSIFPSWPFNPVLLTDTVEGDDIYLEHTTAKVVRGANVRIGEGCQIDLVEYRNKFEKDSDPTIKVNEARKI